jgi:YD repeat-containing protein
MILSRERERRGSNWQVEYDPARRLLRARSACILTSTLEWMRVFALDNRRV